MVAAVQGGSITCESIARDCLDQIAVREAQIGAWQTIDADAVIARARSLDAGEGRGALVGMQLGVKDVIDTLDLLTEYGSPIYRGHKPASDAVCVAQARAVGAILMGKTVTTEFATLHPGKTCNPINWSTHLAAHLAVQRRRLPISWCRPPSIRRRLSEQVYGK